MTLAHPEPPINSSLWIRVALKTDLEASVIFVDTRSTDADRVEFRSSNDGPGLTCNRGEAAAVVKLCDAFIKAKLLLFTVHIRDYKDT